MLATRKKKTAKQQLPFNPNKPFIAELERLGFVIYDDDHGELVVHGPEYDENGDLIESNSSYDEDSDFECHFDITELKNCCGAREIGGFEYAGPDEFELPAYKYMIKQCVDNINTGMIIATHYSDDVVSQALRELGFVEQRFNNPNTNNNLSFFSYIVTPQKPKRKRS